MHVISASRRTDIPAFHSDWFMQRVQKGFASVASPYCNRLFQVSLNPKDVIAIVFWTKNAAPMLPHFDKLSALGYSIAFLYTINNYPTLVEPLVPEIGHTIGILESIARRYGPSAIRWRYDTIVMSDELDYNWHLSNFRNLCGRLAGYTDECIFSFCDYYKKTMRNMERISIPYREPTQEECVELAEMMADVARNYDITLSSCAHDFLVSGKILKGRCIDPRSLSRIVDSQDKLDALRSLRTRPTRKQCGCYASKDIGAYDTCAHGCVYCYANADLERALRNLSVISPDHDCLDPNRSSPTPG